MLGGQPLLPVVEMLDDYSVERLLQKQAGLKLLTLAKWFGWILTEVIHDCLSELRTQRTKAN